MEVEKEPVNKVVIEGKKTERNLVFPIELQTNVFTLNGKLL